MAILFIVLGSIFTLMSIIMLIPTKKEATGAKIKGTVLSCLEETPDLENLLDYASKIDINKTKFSYKITVECIENGERVERVITSDKKKQIGDSITFNLNTNPEEEVHVKEKKVTGTFLGGIVGIILGLAFLAIGILYLLKVI